MSPQAPIFKPLDRQESVVGIIHKSNDLIGRTRVNDNERDKTYNG